MSQPHVLLIDDDPALLRLLSQYLEQAGYRVSTATDGKVGLRTLYADRPDLVVLDVMMPELDGWQMCARIREMSDLPIIMLTAKGEEPDRLRGFRLGVDDYVVKPFSFAELAARIEAVLKRTQPEGEKAPEVLRCGDLVVDRAARLVVRAGERIDLTPTEFRLLCVLMENAGRVLSPEQLVTSVWGPLYADATGYVRRYVWYLRQKIEPDPANPQYLFTERGFGYVLRT